MAATGRGNATPRYQIGDNVVIKEGRAREHGTVLDVWSLSGDVFYLVLVVDSVRAVIENDVEGLRP
jgi:hypothetical protein